MTTVSKPRYVVQLIVFPKYLLKTFNLSKEEKENINKTEMVNMYIIYDTKKLEYGESFPDNKEAAFVECYKLNYISIYKAEVAESENDTPDKLRDIIPYQKSEDDDEEYENISDEDKVKLFEHLEKKHGVENVFTIRPRRKLGLN